MGVLESFQQCGSLLLHIVADIQLQLRTVLQNQHQPLNDKAVPAAAELSVNRLDPA